MESGYTQVDELIAEAGEEAIDGSKTPPPQQVRMAPLGHAASGDGFSGNTSRSTMVTES